MRVLVLGRAWLGDKCYYLAKQGVEVTVIDRQAGAAQKPVLAMLGKSPQATLPLGSPLVIPLKAVKMVIPTTRPFSHQVRW